MSHARCAPACALFDLPDVHVLPIEHDPTVLTLTIETTPGPAGCPGCGVLASAHGRREPRLHDVPGLRHWVRLLWRKRLWRCHEPACAVVTFSEIHELAALGTRLTHRAEVWATDALAHHDTSVSALAHQLGVSWRTAWRAIQLEATTRTNTSERLVGVDALGVDEHVWSHTGPPGTEMVTGIVDHTRDAHGRVHARLLDLVPGRSGAA